MNTDIVLRLTSFRKRYLIKSGNLETGSLKNILWCAHWKILKTTILGVIHTSGQQREVLYKLLGSISLALKLAERKGNSPWMQRGPQHGQSSPVLSGVLCLHSELFIGNWLHREWRPETLHPAPRIRAWDRKPYSFSSSRTEFEKRN